MYIFCLILIYLKFIKVDSNMMRFEVWFKRVLLWEVGNVMETYVLNISDILGWDVEFCNRVLKTKSYKHVNKGLHNLFHNL